MQKDVIRVQLVKSFPNRSLFQFAKIGVVVRYIRAGASQLSKLIQIIHPVIHSLPYSDRRDDAARSPHFLFSQAAAGAGVDLDSNPPGWGSGGGRCGRLHILVLHAGAHFRIARQAGDRKAPWCNKHFRDWCHLRRYLPLVLNQTHGAT